MTIKPIKPCPKCHSVHGVQNGKKVTCKMCGAKATVKGDKNDK